MNEEEEVYLITLQILHCGSDEVESLRDALQTYFQSLERDLWGSVITATIQRYNSKKDRGEGEVFQHPRPDQLQREIGKGLKHLAEGMAKWQELREAQPEEEGGKG
jgi:hypothetical protein